MTKVKVGQMALYIWREKDENPDWIYLIVKNVFDGAIEFYRQDGTRHMEIRDGHELNGDLIFANQEPETKLTFLYSNGSPTMAKKKLFGGFKFEPKTN